MKGMVTEYKVVFGRRTKRRLSNIKTTELDKSDYFTKLLNEQSKQGWQVKQMTSTASGDDIFYAFVLEKTSSS